MPEILLIVETTFTPHDTGGYPHVPGVYTDTQIEAWKKVHIDYRFLSIPTCLTVRLIESGHWRRSCQRIVHIPPTLGIGSHPDAEFLQKQDSP